MGSISEVDLLVILGGMAGVTAAARAAHEGLRVIVVEIDESLGGFARFAGYVWTAASQTAMDTEHPHADRELRQALVEDFEEGVDWIRSMGIAIGSPIITILRFGRGHPFDTMHYIDACRRVVLEHGEVLTRTRTIGLIQTDGVVAGAELELPRHIHATPDRVSDTPCHRGIPGVAGTRTGARPPCRCDYALALEPPQPWRRATTGIFRWSLNRSCGFGFLRASRAEPAPVPGRLGLHRHVPVLQRARRVVQSGQPTLRGRDARRPAQVRDKLRLFNESVASGDILPGRLHDARPLDEPPFYVIECVPAITFPFVGIRIDSAGRALKTDNTPVPGLLAAGSDTGGVHVRAYAGGPASALVFGLRAAKTASGIAGA